MKFIRAWLHRQTVHRKLMLLIAATCCATMLVAGAALFGFLTFTLRQSFERDAGALAEIIAANCAGPVSFGDREAAVEVMESLKAHKHVVGATISLLDGRSFASMGQVDVIGEDRPARTAHQWLNRTHLLESSPIVVDGEVFGTLHVVSDIGPIYLRLFKGYVLVFLVTFAGAGLLGYVVTRRARTLISGPIQSLAESVRVVSERRDYSVRAQQGAGGEVGQLADVINLMLERIEADAQLAKEVAERRRMEMALRESEERFRSLFENALIGLYRTNESGHFLMANPALLNMLGYTSCEELAGIEFATGVCLDPKDRDRFRESLTRHGVAEENEVQWRRRDGHVIHVRESAKAIRNAAGAVLYFEGCVEDITARKAAEAELQRLHGELVDASRAAGKAEVATGVLHNVGNVLNSVGVSAQLLHEQVGRSKLESLRQAVALLNENLPDAGTFFANDPKGKLLPDYLVKVTTHVLGEHARWLEELRQLKDNVEHMKAVVAMQQGYARARSLAEPVVAATLLEDALRLNQAALQRGGVQVVRDYQDVSRVMADKHKMMQILVNLLQNASSALDEAGPERRLDLTICQNGSGNVKILVGDNGVGIARENLTRMFSHGFTTRRDGHGFGLHSSAIAAQEMGGRLSAHSDGPGRGATFTLELPAAGGLNS